MGHAGVMRWILLLALVGCGSNEAGTRPDVDAGQDLGVQAAGGSGGSAGAGIDAAAGAPSGGSTGAAGMATALSCLIPETEITAVGASTLLSVTGPPGPATSTQMMAAAACRATYDQTVTPGIYQGQVITGAFFTNGWAVQHYSINPSPTDPGMCLVNINFICAGCAGTCGDASFEVTLTVPPR